jgi:hypothetical protein
VSRIRVSQPLLLHHHTVELTGRTTGEEDPGVLSDAPSQQSLEQDTRPSVVGDFSLPPHQTEGTQTGSNVPPSYKGPGAASIKTTSKTFVQTEEIRGGASKHARLTFDSIINRKATRSRHDEHNKKHAAWQAGDYPTFAEKRSRLLAKLGFRSKQTSYATDSLDLGELPGPIIYIPTGSGSQERSMPEPSMSDSAASPRQDNSLQLPCSTLDIRKTRTHMPPPH